MINLAHCLWQWICESEFREFLVRNWLPAVSPTQRNIRKWGTEINKYYDLFSEGIFFKEVKLSDFLSTNDAVFKC